MKFVRRDLVCWSDISSDWWQRCYSIIDVIGNMITTSGTGWSYDSRTPAGTYIQIRQRDDASVLYPIQYFVNSSGAKLMVMVYNYYRNYIYSYARPWICNKNYFITEWMNNQTDYYNYGVIPTGVSMAIIPAGSSSEFPNSIPSDDTTVWMPNDAIPLVVENGNFSTFTDYSPIANVSMSNTLSIGLFIDSEFISYLSSYSTTSIRSNLTPRYAIGKIFGTLAHSDDNLYTSKYGAIKFYFNNYNLYYGYGLGGQTVNFYGYGLYNGNSDNDKLLCCFFDKNGNRLNFRNRFAPSQADLLTSGLMVNASTDVLRWTPIAVGHFYDDTNNVVTGDGFKGYLDTNLFRAALGNYCQLYNNGNFVCIGYNTLLAFDQTATDRIN